MTRYDRSSPQSIFEAKQRLLDVQADITSIKTEIGNAETRQYRIDIATGERLSEEQFEVWLARARGALRHMLREEALCMRYLFQYERDVKRDEIAEQRAAKAQAVVEQAQRMGAAEALSKMGHNRKIEYKRWLKLLEMDERIKETDPENILRHTYRLLCRLGREGRVHYTDAEKALINLIQQLPYVRNAMQDGLD
jgi:hypothetical protein